MNNEQLNELIETVAKEFHGQAPDLYQMVGIVMVGRLFGWRVIRLTISRRMWVMVTRSFGDPKEWMPEEGPLVRKSVGLQVVKRLGDYWDFINGVIPRDGFSEKERKTLA